MPQQLQPDYIISGRYLLPDSRQENVVECGAVAVHGDTIVAAGPAAELTARFPQSRTVHEEHGLIIPGLVNVHTHAAMSCFRGLADDLPLMTWLEEHIFPIEAQLTNEMVFDSALLSIAEMIKSGTTSFCDMYLFSDDVAKAAAQAGIRAWVGEVLYDFPSPCYGTVDKGIEYLTAMIERYSGDPLISVTVDPHSVYTCSPELLTELGEVAKTSDCLYVIHLSENEAEVQTCLERYGVRPVEHLANLGLLSPRMLACHCVNLSENDITLLQKNRVKVAHCIESNMKLASGIAPVAELIRRHITVGIGTDGSASNNDVDMFSEMNSVAKMQKIAAMDPTVMSAEQTLAAATLGGAEALGAMHLIGTLEEGKKADFIVIDLDQPHLVPLYNIPSHLTYVARGADVMHTFVGGKQLMKNRKLTTIDEADLLAKIREMAMNIKEMDR